MIGEAIAAGLISGRLWLYSNYHCNLACTYCLTESAPGAPARLLRAERMVALAAEGATLGFTELGVTGGEPFLVPSMAETVADLGAILPVVVNTNATLFGPARLRRLRPLAELPVAVQVSLDSADPTTNDSMRGAGNFARVVEAVARLVEMGIRVRIATTVEDAPPGEAAQLCDLHRRLGVPDDDHVVRPVVRRGRAAVAAVGTPVAITDLPPELTITADGAFWSPFGPTVTGGRLDTDLLLTRTTTPLRIPTAAMARLAEGNPDRSAPTTLGIR